MIPEGTQKLISVFRIIIRLRNQGFCMFHQMFRRLTLFGSYSFRMIGYSDNWRDWKAGIVHCLPRGHGLPDKLDHRRAPPQQSARQISDLPGACHLYTF